MKSKNRSALVSLVTVCVFAVLLLVLLGAAPPFFRWFFAHYNRPTSVYHAVLTTFYCVAPLAVGVLYCLIRLLYNILHETVFVPVNVRYLRAISVFLFLAAIVCTVAGFFYLPFFLCAVACAFVTMIVRVVKNCFDAAVLLQDDSDLTI